MAGLGAGLVPAGNGAQEHRDLEPATVGTRVRLGSTAVALAMLPALAVLIVALTLYLRRE